MLPSRVSISGQLASTLGSMPPPYPWPARGWIPRFSRPEALGYLLAGVEAPLSGLHSLSKTEPGSELPLAAPLQAKPNHGAFLEVFAPSAFPIPGQRLSWRASHGPTACVSRFSQPHDAFIRPEHPSLISCQSRSWGSPYRALFLATQAASVSGAVALLPLEPPLETSGPREAIVAVA